MSASLIPWRRGSYVNSWDRLNDRLGDLELLLEEFFKGLFSGPVAAAYLTISIHRPGSVSAASGVWRLLLPVEARPLLVSVAVRSGSGEVTVDVNDDGASILTSPLTTSSGIVAARSRASFASQKVVAGSVLTLDVDSITGTPTDLSVYVVFKDVGKIEPA